MIKSRWRKYFKKILQSVAFFQKKLIFVLTTLFSNDSPNQKLCCRTTLPYEKEKALRPNAPLPVACADSNIPLGTTTPNSPFTTYQ